MPAHLHSTGLGHMAVARPGASSHILKAHQIISLRPQTNSELLVVHGRVWVTMGAGSGTPELPESGDWVLCSGEQLALPAGAHVVVESWPQEPGEVVRFEVAADPTAAQAVSLAACPTPYSQSLLQRCLPTRSLRLKPAA